MSQFVPVCPGLWPFLAFSPFSSKNQQLILAWLIENMLNSEGQKYFLVFLLVQKDLTLRFEWNTIQWGLIICSFTHTADKSSSVHSFPNNVKLTWVNLLVNSLSVTLFGWPGRNRSFYRIVSVTLTAPYHSAAVTSEPSWQALHERGHRHELRYCVGLNHQFSSGCQACQALCNSLV